MKDKRVERAATSGVYRTRVSHTAKTGTAATRLLNQDRIATCLRVVQAVDAASVKRLNQDRIATRLRVVQAVDAVVDALGTQVLNR